MRGPVTDAVPGASSVKVTERVFEPSSRYKWLPLTVNVPLPPLTVPASVVPSPQSIEATKSLGKLPANVVSLNVATVPVKVVPSVAETVSGPSSIVSMSVTSAVPVAVAEAVPGESSGSEERRVGEECGGEWRARGSP